MGYLHDYLQDGANYNARAVLMLLQGKGDIETSWNDTRKKYEAEIKVGRWENCREQGYVLSLNFYKNKIGKQLNIVFFEHRNSDNISAVKWEQITMNTPTIDTAEFGEVYKTKYDTSFEVKYNECYKMAEWIWKELNKFWEENLKENLVVK